MRCQAFLDEKDYSCGKPNAKVCDMCEHYYCDEHANVMDGDATKYHTHFVCWASHIFQMFERKKDIPKPIIDKCPRCKILCIPSWVKDMPKTELFPVNHKDFMNVCGLCKSEILDELKSH